MADEKLIKIRVKPRAKQVIAETADELGMKQEAVASRVYTWFAEVDDVTRKHILSLLPKGHELDILRNAVARYEQQKKGRKS